MRVLTRPRWIAGHVVVLVVVVLFVNLGLWQLRRHDWRAARNAEIAQGLAAEPAPLDALPAGDRAYRPTVVRGRYLPDTEVLLTPRTERGPGHHVVTPLELPDGRLLVVDRGWIPFALDTPPVEVAAPPPGQVTVEGVLLPASRTDPRAVRDEAGRILRVRTVDPQALAGGGRVVEDVFLLLRDQRPAPGRLPVPGPLPEPDAGPHLSYAVQWFLFALVGAVGYPLLLRRAVRDAQPPSGRSGGGPPPPLGRAAHDAA